MAYAVEKGSRRFVGTGGVIAVHAALAYLLVFGLAAPEFIRDPEHRILGVPVNPPVEPPKPEEKQKEEPKTQTEDPVFTPDPPWNPPTTSDPPAPNPPLPPIGDPSPPWTGGGNTGGGTIEPPPFTPKLARPINDVLRWVTTRDYPRSAIRGEEQGVARFRLEVGANGRVMECTIIASSGSKALDDATCAKVTSRAKFEPAMNQYGEKVPGIYSNSVNWVLPE